MNTESHAEMVVDSSAILCIAFAEPEETRLVAAMAGSSRRYISPVNWTESMMVAERRGGRRAGEGLVALLSVLGIQMAPASDEIVWEVHEAWRKFGKGRHPAALNLGDCWAYATAKVMGEPLLFKGNDFSLTDAETADW